MRLDPVKGNAVRADPGFESVTREAAVRLARDEWGRQSLSGHERDRFFLSRGGRQFTDLSLISGADHKGDGRALALLDYDRDGWIDMAVANTNKPTLLLWRNQLSLPRRVCAIRLIGGPRSNRDAIGARVVARMGERLIVRELHAGEGNAAQNGKTLVIGLGDADGLEDLEIRWPSGTRQMLGRVDAGNLITVTEGRPDPTTVRYTPDR